MKPTKNSNAPSTGANDLDGYRRIIHMAKEHASRKDCPACSKRDWKVVSLHEYGDFELPSAVVITCNACKRYNEEYAAMPDHQVVARTKALADEMKKEKTENDALADKLIIKK